VTGSDGALRPLAGDPRTIESLVGSWLDADDARPLWVRTSGSSGEPKDVVLGAAALRASAAATLRRLGGPGQWTLALPAHYVAGLQVIVRSLLAGTSPVLLDDYESLPAAAAALGSGRRYLAIVPTQLHRWLAAEPALDALRGYDAVLVGGAPAAERDLAAARDAGVAVVTTYGMSETCGGCVYDGTPLDGVAVALGLGGRIRIAGPVLFDGYANRPDLTAEALRDGWLTTPDIGEFDDDGLLRVLGRADDVVVSGGVNVPIASVESVVRSLPGVAACAVVARPDPEWGQVVCAVVESADSAAAVLTLDAVRDAVSSRHPRAWAPRELVFTDALPLLESGKVDRVAVASALASVQAADAVRGSHG
jgi:O-succinylbenzoic acid--CoA ligase